MNVKVKKESRSWKSDRGHWLGSAAKQVHALWQVLLLQASVLLCRRMWGLMVAPIPFGSNQPTGHFPRTSICTVQGMILPQLIGLVRKPGVADSAAWFFHSLANLLVFLEFSFPSMSALCLMEKRKNFHKRKVFGYATGTVREGWNDFRKTGHLILEAEQSSCSGV